MNSSSLYKGIKTESEQVCIGIHHCTGPRSVICCFRCFVGLILVAAALCGFPLYAGSTGSTATVDDLSWPSNQSLVELFGLPASENTVVSSLLSLEGYGALSGASSSPGLLFSGFLTRTQGYQLGTTWSDGSFYQAPSPASPAAAIEAALFNALAGKLSSGSPGNSKEFLDDLESSIVSAANSGSSIKSSELTSMLSGQGTAITRQTTGLQSPPSAVPEPATLVLLGCLLVALSLVLATRSVQTADETPEASSGESWHRNT